MSIANCAVECRRRNPAWAAKPVARRTVISRKRVRAECFSTVQAKGSGLRRKISPAGRTDGRSAKAGKRSVAHQAFSRKDCRSYEVNRTSKGAHYRAPAGISGCALCFERIERQRLAREGSPHTRGCSHLLQEEQKSAGCLRVYGQTTEFARCLRRRCLCQSMSRSLPRE